MNKVMELWERTKWLWYSVVIVVCAVYWMSWTESETQRLNMQRREVICPSYLSIARSARDTLIVMRNDQLCNRYVLDNLK